MSAQAASGLGSGSPVGCEQLLSSYPIHAARPPSVRLPSGTATEPKRCLRAANSLPISPTVANKRISVTALPRLG